MDSQVAIRRLGSDIATQLPGARVKAITTSKQSSDFMDMLGVFQSNPPAFGTTAMLKGYSTMPWLRAVVDKVGSSVATTTWRVFVKVETDDDGKRRPMPYRQLQNMERERRAEEMFKMKAVGQLVEIEDHPLIDALYATGPTFTGFTNRELTQKWLDLVGESFWLKERNDSGMPVNFIPIPPHWVTDTPKSKKPYFVVNPPNGQPYNIDEADVIWFYHPDPYDPYARGSGMGITLGDELETDEYAAKFMKMFFYNSARPDVLISAAGLKREDTSRLEQRWTEKLRGWRRSFLPMFMNREVKVHPLGTDYSHLSMLELRKNQRDAVIQVYGVPPEVLGIVEASNRATSEVAEYLYSRWVLTPRLEFMRQILQHRLVPDYDDRLIIDYDSPVAQDKEHILKVATIAPWSRDLDEWREMQGLLPLPDGQGEVFMKPLNYEAITAEDLAEPPSQQGDGTSDDQDPSNDDPAVEPDEDDDDMDEPVEEAIRWAWPELLANVISRQRVTPAIGTRRDQIKARLLEALIEIADNARKRHAKIEEAIGSGSNEYAVIAVMDNGSIKAAMDPLLAKLSSVYVLAAEMAAENLAPFVNDEGFIGKLEPLYELNSARSMVEESIVSSIEKTLRSVAEYAEWSGASAETMTHMLIDAIGIREGDLEEFHKSDGRDDIDLVLLEKFIEEIADHAIVHMCNCAQEALWSEAVKEGILDPAKVARLWISRLGCRSCNECSGMDGVIAAIDGSWDLPGGDTVVSPTDAHPECHCTEQLVRKEVQREAAE